MNAHSRLLNRSSAAVPRYTSYPTANHFTPAVTPVEARGWLRRLPDGAHLSLYAHIPFCRQLCWYCACTTKMTKRAEPVEAYLTTLLREIETVGRLVPAAHEVRHIHWGGGSPSLMDGDQIRRLAGAMKDAFRVGGDAEIAVEIDPRDLDVERADALAEVGVTRVSLGVQDFEPRVQDAINRQQSFALTRDVIQAMRDRGIASINIDLVYGLPHQTTESVARTIDAVLELAPDRLAVFGYAHLPQRVKHQRLIEDAALPGTAERLAQAIALARHIAAAGYREVGLDHYAKPGDAMAEAAVRRNFQGYTTDAADALIGLGASAISQLPQGFAQNATSVHDYERRIAIDGLGTARGIALSVEDRIRADVIERLMCDFTFSGPDLLARHGPAAERVIVEAAQALAEDEDGLMQATEDGFRVTREGRALVRTICAQFDTYLSGSTARHSPAV